ncbi:MAG TPA: DUF6531 domain-containing protein [Solirubrobacterales bacterium]|nr:DUF6531 domain-containing protein [Solirubrobacterales bacterium]
MFAFSLASPGLASESAAPVAEESAPSVPAPSDLPDALDVQEGIEAAERAEAERKRWLQSPEAIREREESRYAFADLTAEEAQEVLLTMFAEQLSMLNADPARRLSDSSVVEQLGPSAAAVREGGERLLLNASIPLRANDEQGESRKLDLELEATPEGFEPLNPLTELRIPDEADEPIAVGEEGLAVSSPAAAESREGEPLGEMNVFFPDAFGENADADRIVSPTGTGVEIFDLLRSAESPETLRFELELPEGAELRSDGNGGAVVVRGEEQLASIPFPHAVDAQGTYVPVDLSVEGDMIVLQIDHREADLAYPLLVDPAIVNDWYNYSWAQGHNLQVLTNGTWNASGNTGWIQTATSCLVTCFSPSGRGLYIAMPSGNHSPNSYSHWLFNAPNSNSFLAGAWVNPFNRANYNCEHYYQPHDYVGMWHNGAWNTEVKVNHAAMYGYTDPGGWGSTLIIGMSTGSGVNIPCRREAVVGGTAIWEGDWQDPVLEGISGIPSGWFGDQTQANVTAHARDDGLGVYSVVLYPEGTAVLDHFVGCSGLVNSRCPTSYGYKKSFTALSLGEGIRTIEASAKDPLGKVSGTTKATVMVDRSPPVVTLSGQLAEATKEVGSEEKPPGTGDELWLPVYNLTIAATDGSKAEAKTKRSGVKDIEVWLDGKEREVPWAPQPCPAPDYSCPMERTYQLNLDTLTSAGKHVLEVFVKDQVGNQRKRSIEFEYIPATGIKDEYVMHYFPLPDGQGSEAEEEHPARPELAVNVMNGNLVYREKDVDIERAAVDLEVERYYNSQLPEAENTEWGDGWTLAQTPELEPVKTNGSSVPNEAEILESSSAIEGGVELPTAAGGESFDPALQATLTKKSTGGYVLDDETGEAPTSVAFDAGGQAEALLTEGYAKVDLEYASGKLSEIAVEDPATAAPVEGEEEPQDASELPTYQSAFGSYGNGNGQFQSTRDAAVDTAGNVWVIDLYGERVQQFTPDGQFIRQVGGPGWGNGQFSYPSGIAAAPDGTVWVADAGNSRIQQFGPEGEFLQVIEGWGSGQFYYPEGIAVGPDGKVWVADTANHRVVKLDAEGKYLSHFGSEGTEDGQFNYPAAIEVDAQGDVWVADTYNSRIQKFSPSGEYLLQAGGEGYGDGQLYYPMGIAADSEGRIWVADTSSSRIEGFDPQGQHVGRFGSEGAEPGQLQYPMGIDADAEGSLWVADTENNRVQHWIAAVGEPRVGLQMGGFGSAGAEAGQLSQPGGVAVAPDGDVWVADTSNHRIQQLDAEWQPVRQFGSNGSGPGQLSSPRAVALDPGGNIWVADTSNHRVQKFDSEGNFLLQSGSYGTANGQFSSPMGIATDAQGNVWVADTFNNRVQQLNGQGEFLGKFGSSGAGNGQLSAPTAVALDGSGNVWVAEALNHRLQQFTSQGQFIRKLGSEGSGDGQFVVPQGLAVDQSGDIWVADTGNHRVQGFTKHGKHLTTFGAQGSASDEFSSPIGIVATSEGNLLVADSANDRIRQWRAVAESALAAPPPGEADPAVDVEVVGGLVAEVEGNAAGEHSYAHSGNDLVAHDGPDGETAYEYDPAGRMTKVTLPNGTWGSIAYHGDGRVKSVTVKVGSDPAKTTEFQYSDEPRRTTVDPPDSPRITYDIGDDGSVFKWWNTAEPPLIEIAGTLYDFKEKPGELWAGDHWLEVDAFDAEGIASIEVIANGDVLVDEKHCEQDPETPEVECEELESQWVAETGAHAPGRLDLEVSVTDSEGISAAERFWVDIPRSPPIAPGAPVPPKFKDVARFREEFGLEVVFPVKGEVELNERIFSTIGAWHNPHTPAGEVARASWERWGVPLRAEDVAELDYREWLYEVNAEKIDQWVEATSPSSYAGYYLDHAAGGIMHIGFLGNQAEQLANLEASLSLVGGSSRLSVYPNPPTAPYVAVRATTEAVMDAIETNSTLADLVISVEDDEAGKATRVGTSNVAQVEGILDQMLGANAPVAVEYETGGGALLEGRYRNEGRMRAGDYINSDLYFFEGIPTGEPCTAGFGAKDKVDKPGTKKDVHRLFVLTAGHCAVKRDQEVWRNTYDGDHQFEFADAGKSEVGRVARSAFQWADGPGRVRTDGTAIRISQGGIVPRAKWGWDGHALPTEPAGRARKGNVVCYSGAVSKNVSCGKIVARSLRHRVTGGYAPFGLAGYWVRFPEDRRPVKGDSGSPVWNKRTGASIGLVSFGRPLGTFEETLVAPLLHPPHMPPNRVPGILHHHGMAPLQLKLGG